MPDTINLPNPSAAARRYRIGEVLRVTDLSPHMRRVTFTGPDLEDFPEDRNGGNIKLFLPEQDWSASQLRDTLQSGNRPTTRTFTARRYTAATNELDVDFVQHTDGGPAATWAAKARRGDFLGIAGPSARKLVAQDADWFLICADMSGIPAALAAVEDLPANAEGRVFFEVASVADKLDVKAPPSMPVVWLINDDPHQVSLQQLNAIKKMSWRRDRVSVFVAGESTAVRALRQYLRYEKKVPREDCYISGYWKVGLIEDQHQIEKRKDGNV